MNTQIVTENNTYAEALFSIGSFEVTNSLITTWIVVLFIFTIGMYFKKKGYSMIPGRVQTMLEMGIEQLQGFVMTATGGDKRAKFIFPIVFTVFIFILLNNLFGLLPGFGTIGQLQNGQDVNILNPFLRTGTADLNTTLALAFFSVIVSNLFGLFTIGVWNTINRFINVTEGIYLPLVNFKRNPNKLQIIPLFGAFLMDVFLGMIKLVIGVMDLVAEFAKVISLSFRLFGNMYAGQVLLATMGALAAFFVPIPFYFTSLISACVQALVFSMLTMVYFTMASQTEVN